MTPENPDVLISGASIAGPTLAYWLRRHGFNPTVVERTPALRIGGGHGIDLFGSAMDVAERMGILPQVQAARTRNQRLAVVRPGKQPIEIDVSRIVEGVTDRHVEIMRGELASILYERTRDDVEYVFGDSIRALDEDAAGVKVTFERGGSRRFDLVVGADGLHSNVRRLVFGEEARFRRYLGGYLCVYTIPNYLGLDGLMLMYHTVDRMVATYPVGEGAEARALFLLRRAEEFQYDHRDTEHQKRLLREAFAADGWEVPHLLERLGGADHFYFDSISQIRMDTWSRGRVTLVGDAGYSPGPAVGGGSSLAVIAAYVLAGELAAAGGDHTTGFGSYERRLRDTVARSWTIGPKVMKSLLPRNDLELWLTTQLLRVMYRLPRRVRLAVAALAGSATRTLSDTSSLPLEDDRPADPAA